MTLVSLSKVVVDQALAQVLGHWQPGVDDRLRFRGWALMMLDVCSSLSEGDPVQCMRDLEVIRREINGQVAERLLRESVIDLDAVSRISWLGFLVRQLGTAAVPAPLAA